MKIRQLFEFVEGEFDTEKDKLVCVSRKKYNEVRLCYKYNMNIPFAQIELYSNGSDAAEVFEDAEKLGEEICKRWNDHTRLTAAATDLLEALLNIENDNNSIPETIWEMRNNAIRKATLIDESHD